MSRRRESTIEVVRDGRGRLVRVVVLGGRIVYRHGVAEARRRLEARP